MPILALLVAQAIIATPPCAHDRARLMALDQPAFDQDMTGGWRALAMAGCDSAAADLIRDWRAAHTGADMPNPGILFWHEGQLRANAGQTAAAIALFDRSRKTAAEDAGFGWNLYVDGSIAFLRRDRAGFDMARATLAVLPRPAGFDPRGPDGKPVTVRWPMNLNVLDGFRRCWNRPYKEAYTCATPMRRVVVPPAK